MNSPYLIRLVCSLAVLTCAAVGLRAQFAVAVAIDAPALLEWGAEEAYWSSELKALAQSNLTLRENNAQLNKANSTLRQINDRLGSPTEGAKLAFGGYTKADTPSSTFINEVLTREALVSKSADEDPIADTLSRVNDLTTRAVGVSYKIETTEYARDVRRYRITSHEEKLRDALNHAVEAFQKLQLTELEFQTKQSDGMSTGTLTMSEIEARSTAIESSQGRVDLARNRLELARAELETFLGQVRLEQRKVQAANLEEYQMVKTKEHELADKMRAKVGL